MISSVDICTLNKANLMSLSYNSDIQVIQKGIRSKTSRQKKNLSPEQIRNFYIQQRTLSTTDIVWTVSPSPRSPSVQERNPRCSKSKKKNAELKNDRDQTTVNSRNIPSFKPLSNQLLLQATNFKQASPFSTQKEKDS